MPQQLPLGLTWRPAAAGAEDFIVAPSNVEAVALVDRWPDWPASTVAPALLLMGPPASGKTHLAHAWAARANAMYVDRFTDLAAVQGATVLDDCQRWASAAQPELFHLLNRAKEAGFSVLLCAAAPPEAWGLTLPDLLSRLKSLPVAHLQTSDDALLGALFAQALEARGLQIRPDALDYALPRLLRNAADLPALAAALDAFALAGGKGLTLAVVRNFFKARSSI